MTDVQAQDGLRIHPRRLRLIVLRTLIRIIGLVSVVRRSDAARRPTAAELMAMDDEAFDAFLRKIGLNTRSQGQPAEASPDPDRA